METLIVALACLGAAVLVAAVGYGLHLGAKRTRRPVRSVECRACGRELPASKAVVVTGTVMDHGQGAGSAMVAEYHRRCLPRT